MKTESELLELYADAYKTRSIENIKDYIPAIIQYVTPESYPKLIIKSQFLSFLQDKFDGQKKQVPIEHESIVIVDNETTGKENIYIDFGKRKEFLFSIDVDNGLFERITISNIANNKFTKKKIILTKEIENIPDIMQNVTNLQKSSKFKYLNSGVIVISEGDNPNEVIDVIINTNYSYELCVGVNFNIQYLYKLIKSGFYLMSSYYIHKNLYLMEAWHHLSRSVLYFDHLHIKKSIKNSLQEYELKENTDFNKIVNKCIENHNDKWLTKPLVSAIKKIHRINKHDVSFISFGLYRDGKLVAGEFGTKVGRIYSSYSGFYEEDNSGNVQMILTAQYLKKNGYAFWDLGMPIEYKKNIGAKIINLEDFIIMWRKYSIQTIGLNLKNIQYQNKI